MKAIMIMFDSLNRRMLPPYGCDWVKAENFKRLADKCVTFDNSYAGSLPCMPARRELHTGRYNFMHRSWSPLEPFDDSMPEILKRNGVHTHLVSDHLHYWEDGGSTYHSRYSTWEIVRGQQGDTWKGEVKKPAKPEHLGNYMPQDAINKQYMLEEEQLPQPQTFKLGMEFIEKNKDEDNWFVQIETFDPHEPFYTMEHYKIYGNSKEQYSGPDFSYPTYDMVKEEEKPFMRQPALEYASLVTMCDNYLGKVLDMMDKYDLWKDTMLIVNTDHGYLLGEHGWWAKSVQPYYQEVVHTPLFIFDPRCSKTGRNACLVQTIDIAPTLLDYFNVPIPSDMRGFALKDVIENETPVRKAALFGYHGGHLDCTDGKYVYMLAPDPSVQLYEYTLMPMHMTHMFSVKELQGKIELSPPFDFTKGCSLMKIPSSGWNNPRPKGFTKMLYDVENDPHQLNPIEDEVIEKKMRQHMIQLMKEHDAPQEYYFRMGLAQE